MKAEDCELLTEEQRNSVASIRKDDCRGYSHAEKLLVILDNVVELLQAKVEARNVIMAELNAMTEQCTEAEARPSPPEAVCPAKACPDCEGSGSTPGIGNYVPCIACDGTGEQK